MWHLRLLLLLKRYGRTLAQHSHTLGDYHLASLESRAHDVVLTIVLRYLDNLRHGLAIDWLVYVGLILHLEAEAISVAVSIRFLNKADSSTLFI